MTNDELDARDRAYLRKLRTHFLQCAALYGAGVVLFLSAVLFWSIPLCILGILAGALGALHERRVPKL